MNHFRSLLSCVIILFWMASPTTAQELSQTIRGTIIDQDTKIPLIGANILVLGTTDPKGATTDVEGYFKIEKVPLGRVSLQVTYLGYESAILSEIMVTSGKEVVLNVALVESIESLEEVVVVAKLDKENPLNEMATVSARSFSVEETSRYAASFYDPARMALNYAGVAIGGGTDDLNNEIVVRGNSPKGILWRLEGIEIPNPNHFASLGSSGGGVSMLSSTMLTNSDFYTGAFPAEFGNALSGVFDVRLRNGNNEKNEYAFMLSVLGLEAGIEGPFSKNSKASYLLNYRYSTLGLLTQLGLNLVDDDDVTYQDLSFKINLPTSKAGTFALFGLGGNNSISFEPARDASQWQFSGNGGYREVETVGTLGLSHRKVLTEKSYLQSVAIVSNNQYRGEGFFLEVDDNYRRIVDDVENFDNFVFRVKTTYTHKLNAKSTIRAGAIFSYESFVLDEQELDFSTNELFTIYDNKGSGTRNQAFAQWKYRFNPKWTLNTGFHLTHLGVNDKISFEPRLALQYQMNPRQKLSAALGIHSKPEHIALYVAKGNLPNGETIIPSPDLDMTKSLHAVLGYDWKLFNNLRLKTELYYQYLYQVPVTNDVSITGFKSALNALNVWELVGTEALVNDGTGRNFGVDITLEKFFSKGSYFMVTTSLFDSKFKGKNGKTFNTRFNSNYLLNVIGGKEFKVGKNKKNRFGLNMKFVLTGGNRDTPIDVATSRQVGRPVYKLDELNTIRLPNYTRIDGGVNYRINGRKMSHNIRLDIQNVLNRENVQQRFFNVSSGNYFDQTQSGLIPVFSYRIEF